MLGGLVQAKFLDAKSGVTCGVTGSGCKTAQTERFSRCSAMAGQFAGGRRLTKQTIGLQSIVVISSYFEIPSIVLPLAGSSGC